jgi:ADP-ribose pyrophosphatase YjhB (NUDIX family)
MKRLHPRADDSGRPVWLNMPSQATERSTWDDPRCMATTVPDGAMPVRLNGVTVATWDNTPSDAHAWEALAAHADGVFTEPPMSSVPGKSAASGVVILENDGRVWVVSPSNAFGDYVNTFPKGKVDAGLSLRANALKEAYEESGLHVQLTGFLCDSVRSTSVTRYYTARRVGGNPAQMGWETQAVHLVPREQLGRFLNHQNDQVVLQALQAL